MNLRFKKIKIVNFGCYQDAEINFEDKGICLVSGENHCSKDGAESNGSGKSTLWNAICYALTGYTISGQNKNLKNMYVEDNSCYVCLEFADGNDNYKLTRYHKPKSDLKVIKNDEDISGKGITESNKVLSENLPQLTYELVANTIILGQGLPAKFSSYTPSGRKDLLEKFTNSSEMIEQAKEKVEARLSTVKEEIDTYTKSILVNNTNLSNAEFSLNSVTQELQNLEAQNYDTVIENHKKEIKKLTQEFSELSKQIEKTESELEKENSELLVLTETKAKEVSLLNENYNQSVLELRGNIQKLELEIKSLNSEILRLKSISDTCPTCGQKLEGVEKPSTEKQEKDVAEKTSQLNILKAELENKNKKYSTYKQEIEANFSNNISEKQKNVSQLKATLSGLKYKQTQCNSLIVDNNSKLSAVQAAKNGRDARVEHLKLQIDSLGQTIQQLKNSIVITEAAKDKSELRLSVIRQIDTRIKRDFRGVLLENVITYIDAKAKEYSKIVFGTKELSLALDGNNLDITYCKKPFDCLSGGEKQRIDLILQFSIRDLLQNSLNYRSNILVLDEITDALDSKSCEAILNLIENKLTDVESIFVISHRAAELNLPFDTEIKVVKSESGVSEIF